MNLTTFSVKNYQFTLIMFIMVAVVGLVTLLTMPQAEDPQINAPEYPVVVIYPGTSPKDMEELVAKPIENQLYELEDIDKIHTSIEDGIAVLFVSFKYGVDVNQKLQEVQREVNGLRGDLPKDIHSIDVSKIDPSDVNILQVAFVSEVASFKDMRTKAEELTDQLEKISNLKKIKISGAPEDVIRIDIELDKLARLNIPLNFVIGSLQSENANIPGGSINAGTKTFNVKTSGKFSSIDDVANTVVFNGNGKIVYLKDIATIGYRNEVQNHITRLNGHRCILVTACQKSGANISSTKKEYEPVVEEFEKSLPSNIKMIKNFDQADNVAHRLGSLGIDFIIAILLVLITLLPLGIRASLIVMVSIPLSLALGLVGLNALGYSLNQLSIVGFVVALGLLVDDSIVVVENIERWLREGYSRTEAAIKATKQISLAVLGCTVTLAIAFMPMVFMPGTSGDFIRSFPTTVITCVLASMLVSLTVVPFLASRILKEHANAEGNIFLRALKQLIRNTYSKLMTKALKRPVLTLLIALVLFGGSLMLFSVIGFKLFPSSEKPIFIANVRMPLQTNIQESDRITRIIEDSLKKNKQIQYFTSNIGKGNPEVYYNVIQQKEKSDFAQIFIQMHENARPLEKIKLIEQLRKQFENFPMAIVEVNDFEQGPPVKAPVSIRVFGDNLDSLRQYSFDVEKIIRSNPGTIYINNELNVLKSDIKVNVNKEKARTLGVMTADIAATVRIAIAGLQVGTYTDKESNDYEVMLNVPRDKVPKLDIFKNLFVNNANGTAIPLNQVATIEFETSPTKINHFNKLRFAEISSYTRKNVLANDVLEDIVPKIEKLNLPKGYYFKLSGEAETQEEAFGGGFMTVILITIFLFIAVLILQFKNFKGTLIVLSVIPLGIVGGVSMLFLTGNPMSFIAIIGFIGLAGIEVKNSILLVDFTNQLRATGVELDAAIEQAGEIRFLPVVLTSLTAIGGMIPLALNPNPQISPLALVLIGGLISSTLLSRIVTPVMYKLIAPKIEK